MHTSPETAHEDGSAHGSVSTHNGTGTIDTGAARLRDLIALHEASAALHAAHAARLGALVERDHARLQTLRTSLSWRVSWPLRAAGLGARALLHPGRAARAVIRRARSHRLRARLMRVLREEGLRVTFLKALRLTRNLSLHGLRFAAIRLAQSDDRLRHWRNVAHHRTQVVRQAARILMPKSAVARIGVRPPAPVPQAASDAVAVPGRIPRHAITISPARLLAPRVLIIGELSIAQCAKYRVWQKREHLVSLGVACEVRDWTDFEAARDALQLCAMVIFYRVPGHPQVLSLFDEARRLGLEVIWEVDDLIFDAALYLADRDLHRLDPEIRQGVLAGAALYDRAWRAADRGIASTPALAALMQGDGQRVVDVVDNSLDIDTLTAAEALFENAPTPGADSRDIVRIVYGSGSRTHDGDFAVAAPALEVIIARYPQTRLRIVGELAIPESLLAFGDRIEHVPTLRYRDYLALLSRADINLAPLEDTPFNSAKSNIKFVEAGILAIPSVCSPTANFIAAIEDGVHGYLPADTSAWIAALDRLVTDPAHRDAVGRAARARVLDRYAPDRVATTQIEPLIAPLAQARDSDAATGRLRVLAVHQSLYAPHPDGKRTLAQTAIETLAARHDITLSLFTTEDLPGAPPYALRRLTDRPMPVFAMRPPRRLDAVLARDDPTAARRFAEVLDAVRPDIVWLRGLSGLGAGLARLCIERDVAYVIDLSDPWWHSKPNMDAHDDAPIDPRLESAVVAGALRHAARLIAPHPAVAAAAVAAGAPAALIEILPPGIDLPSPAVRATHKPSRPADTLRIGYAGTEEGELILRAFTYWVTHYPQDAIGLDLVDHARAEGRVALWPSGRETGRRCRVLPPYDASGRDAFFAGIDVLIYPGDDPVSGAQIAREALARGVRVIASPHASVPESWLVTRIAAPTTDRADLYAVALREQLLPLVPAVSTPAAEAIWPNSAEQAAALCKVFDRCLLPAKHV